MNKLNENEVTQIPFNGYHFGDRLLEGVIFHATIVLHKGEVSVSQVNPRPEHEGYLENLNRGKWMNIALAYAKDNILQILEDAGYEIPPTQPEPARPTPRPFKKAIFVTDSGLKEMVMKPVHGFSAPEQCCANCIHFGELKRESGENEGICMAPITTEPPPNGTTRVKNAFVYEATLQGLCELHTPAK